VKNLKIFIITGLSGSGKSTAIAAFEDAHFYCVDNMPVALLPKFLELPIEKDLDVTGLAFVMDLREKGFLTEYTPIFKSLKKQGYKFEIIFLEADEDILLQRYNQTRRQHPFSKGKDLLDGIKAEKKALRELKRTSDNVINTSSYNVHELKSIIFLIAQKAIKAAPMRLNIISFGFKYGIPLDANLIVDVRFVINPYFVPELKELDGTTQKVKDYVLNNIETQKFLNKYIDFLDYLIPLYEKEQKAYLTIGIGCTGGRHRSVGIAEYIFDQISKTRDQIEIKHRDINR
jgi:UPF0042 nucleotide-binding protein